MCRAPTFDLLRRIQHTFGLSPIEIDPAFPCGSCVHVQRGDHLARHTPHELRHRPRQGTFEAIENRFYSCSAFRSVNFAQHEKRNVAKEVRTLQRVSLREQPALCHARIGQNAREFRRLATRYLAGHAETQLLSPISDSNPNGSFERAADCIERREDVSAN